MRKSVNVNLNEWFQLLDHHTAFSVVIIKRHLYLSLQK